MKNFRKNKQGLLICEECGRTFKICSNLSAHIGIIHNKKEYYDKWLIEENEGICITCKRETTFNNFKRGYKKTCSKKCLAKSRSHKFSEETLKKRKATLIEKYGVDLASRIPGFKEKINKKLSLKTHKEKQKTIKKRKNTCLKHYGVEYVSQLKENKQKSKQTKLLKYGDENYVNIDKSKQSKLKHYGDENYNNIEKGKQTCLQRYGVENPNQNIDIFKKGQKTRFEIKKFKNTNLWYQGSYELDFLEKYYNKFTDLQRGPTVKYIFNKNNKVYYPDFFIPSKNLIIECKNSYLAKKDSNIIKEKEKATISNGFNYIMIIDKNYSIFDSII